MLADRRSDFSQAGVQVIPRNQVTVNMSDAAGRYLNGRFSSVHFLLVYAYFARQLRREVLSSNQSTTLVSNENILGLFSKNMFGLQFRGRPKRVVQTLLYVLRQFEVIIAVYDRDADNLHHSALKQRWNKGQNITVEEWLSRFPDKNAPIEFLNDLEASFPNYIKRVRMEDELKDGSYLGQKLVELAGATKIGRPNRSYQENVGAKIAPQLSRTV
mmetsp:Transcript_1004/g.1942  ORF Transcript_1004/g.1942 Transcript_1004/m.1942 type:complete len:215 (-) Transcript_1004:1438-2082(-)